MFAKTQRGYNQILILALILCSESLLAKWTTASSVKNVKDVVPEEYPWVVSIRVDNSHACVGSIITDRYVLTSGNCVAATETTPIDRTRVTIRVGSVNQFAGGYIVDTKSIVIHPKYGNFLHNLAIIELNEAVKFNERINKIDLAGKNDTIAAGSEVLITGWSLDIEQQSSFQLKQMNMTVITSEECEIQVGFGYASVVCLEHSENYGICQGDQGSGIVYNNTLIGVASFSFGTCGTQYPDISSNIPFYREWIDNVTLSKNDV